GGGREGKRRVVGRKGGDRAGPVVGARAETVKEEDRRGVRGASAAALVVDVRPLPRRRRRSSRNASGAPWGRGSPRSRTSGAPAPWTETPARPAASGSTFLRAARHGRRGRGSGRRAWRSSPGPAGGTPRMSRR